MQNFSVMGKVVDENRRLVCKRSNLPELVPELHGGMGAKMSVAAVNIQRI